MYYLLFDKLDFTIFVCIDSLITRYKSSGF